MRQVELDLYGSELRQPLKLFLAETSLFHSLATLTLSAIQSSCGTSPDNHTKLVIQCLSFFLLPVLYHFLVFVLSLVLFQHFELLPCISITAGVFIITNFAVGCDITGVGFAFGI